MFEFVNISQTFNSEFQKIIFEKEATLYKANNKILLLESKLSEKTETINHLKKQYNFYKKEYEKLISEDDSNPNVVCFITETITMVDLILL